MYHRHVKVEIGNLQIIGNSFSLKYEFVQEHTALDRIHNDQNIRGAQKYWLDRWKPKWTESLKRNLKVSSSEWQKENQKIWPRNHGISSSLGKREYAAVSYHITVQVKKIWQVMRHIVDCASGLAFYRLLTLDKMPAFSPRPCPLVNHTWPSAWDVSTVVILWPLPGSLGIT